MDPGQNLNSPRAEVVIVATQPPRRYASMLSRPQMFEIALLMQQIVTHVIL